jgi:hypothetical protein
VFTTSGVNFREAWVACPATYTAISATAYHATSAVTYRWEPGAMTGADAQAAGAGAGVPVGTTFAASANNALSPNGYHVSTSGNVNTVKLVLICIPN